MRKGELTRRAILDHGVGVAARVGLSGLTIGELARGTGMSKSGLFAHFESKEALQQDVIATATSFFAASVVRPALAAPRGEPRIRELFERWVASGRARQPGCTVLVQGAAEFDDRVGPVRDQLVQDHRDLADSVAQIVRTGCREGHLRDDLDAEQFARDLYGVMLAYYHAHRLLEDPRADERARTAFEALLAAARPPNDPSGTGSEDVVQEAHRGAGGTEHGLSAKNATRTARSKE